MKALLKRIVPLILLWGCGIGVGAVLAAGELMPRIAARDKALLQAEQKVLYVSAIATALADELGRCVNPVREFTSPEGGVEL